MAKTVTELASDLGYTRQYIQKIISRLPANKKPKKVGNKYKISLQNEAVIKEVIKKSQTSATTKTTTSFQNELSAKDTYIQHLEQENNYLQQQLKHSQELLDHEQQLHLTDQKRLNQLERPINEKSAVITNDNQVSDSGVKEQEKTPKKGFFRRFLANKRRKK